MTTTTSMQPLGLKWRSSVWYVTFAPSTLVIGLGITVDLLVYSIIIPVLPFQLERLGYQEVSGLVGWLLFSYSAGIVLSTLPIAAVSERYENRFYLLVSGQVILMASQILLMEAPKYWVMVIARIIQGISSSMIWVAGLALICDTVPEAIVGRQLGIAMTGTSLGLLAGPPIGGALYARFGFHGPFILSISVTAIDLFARLLIIERKQALHYGVDPAALPTSSYSQHTSTLQESPENLSETADSPHVYPNEKSDRQPEAHNHIIVATKTQPLSLIRVFKILLKSSRALTVTYNTLIYGVAFTSQEPALPLYLQTVWGLDSSKVGLIYVASVVPTILSAPLAGWWTDRRGPEWITVTSIVASLPWWGLIAIHCKLAVFIVFFALLSFFTSAVISPLITELAAVARSHEGVGYAHVYGVFNLSYGIGSALGPIIGGQIYGHVERGWLVLCLLVLGLLALSAILAFCYTGDLSLLKRMERWKKWPQQPSHDDPLRR